MSQAGVVTAINSDNREMARRLNQEAGKTIKYGNLSEVEAMKLVTLNPAKLLNLDHRMGSIKIGKDADLVLWNEHPLSIYSKPFKTIVFCSTKLLSMCSKTSFFQQNFDNQHMLF